MRVLKTALVITSAVLFFLACSTPETTNQNANQSSNANAGASAASASDNANSPAASQTAIATNTNASPAKNANEKKKDDSKTAAASKPVNIDAAALYASNKCGACHGADGKGNPKMKDVPDFTDAAWQKKESDAELTRQIKNGKKPMPAYGDKLNDDEIKALVAYVRSLAKM